MKNNLSIDIGGTKIRCIEFSPSFHVRKELCFETKDYLKGRGLKDLASLFQAISLQFNRNYECLGLSMNCALKNKTIIYSSLLKTRNLKLEPVLKKYFLFKKITIHNDVIAMAKAEAKYGIGKKINSFLYINLGTGIRCCYVENNTVVSGFNNLAGEISLLPIWNPRLKKFIVADSLISGRGMSYIAKNILKHDLTAKEVFDKKLHKVISIFADSLSDFLIQTSFFYNPEAIVFGGSLTKSHKQWLPLVKNKYNTYKPDFFLTKFLMISRVDHPASIGALLN